LETISNNLEQLKLADQQIEQQSVSLEKTHDLSKGLSIQQSELASLQNSNHKLATKLTSVSIKQMHTLGRLYHANVFAIR
jgi:hypothetical protein